MNKWILRTHLRQIGEYICRALAIGLYPLLGYLAFIRPAAIEGFTAGLINVGLIVAVIALSLILWILAELLSGRIKERHDHRDDDIDRYTNI